MGWELVASDDFNRANEDPLSGGGNWTTLNAGGLKVVSNQAVSTSSSANCESYHSASSPNDDQYAEAVVQDLAAVDYTYPLVRVSATRNFYAFQIDGGNVAVGYLAKCTDAGGLVVLGASLTLSPARTVEDNGRFRCRVQGSTVYADYYKVSTGTWENWGSRSDLALSSGKGGLANYETGAANPIDDWALYHWVSTLFSRGRIVNIGGIGGINRSSVVNSGGQ